MAKIFYKNPSGYNKNFSQANKCANLIFQEKTDNLAKMRAKLDNQALIGSSPVDTRGTFLDISKAFDKVWHKGLIFKRQYYRIEGNLLTLIKNYPANCKQRVVLNGQTSSWNNILGSLLGPLFILLYINDLPKGITLICKIFADDTSLFSRFENRDLSSIQINEDLNVIINWAYQWKILFNSNPNKQAIEICSSQKHKKVNYSTLFFNCDKVESVPSKKKIVLVLDFKINLNEYINIKISKCNKTKSVMKKLLLTLSRKTFINPLLKPI